MPGRRRGTVLVTGVGRRRSIGAGLALSLADDGWDLTLNYWAPYDDRVSYARGEHDTGEVAAGCRRRGAKVEVLAADLAGAGVPARLVAAAAAAGGLRGLVMSHWATSAEPRKAMAGSSTPLVKSSSTLCEPKS